MADDAIVANDRGLLRCRVDDRVVLDARARTNHDVSVVAAQHCPGPNRRLWSNADVSDDHRVRMDEGGRIDVRYKVSEGIQRHDTTVVRGGIRRVLPVP